MEILTTTREVNYRCSRKRWFYRERPGSRRTPLRLHKSRKVDIAARCNMPLPTAAAAIRLSRIASALSRICNIPRTNNYLSHVKEYRAKGLLRCCLESRQSFMHELFHILLILNLLERWQYYYIETMKCLLIDVFIFLLFRA